MAGAIGLCYGGSWVCKDRSTLDEQSASMAGECFSCNAQFWVMDRIPRWDEYALRTFRYMLYVAHVIDLSLTAVSCHLTRSLLSVRESTAIE
jgi:hypothetical protein